MVPAYVGYNQQDVGLRMSPEARTGAPATVDRRALDELLTEQQLRTLRYYEQWVDMMFAGFSASPALHMELSSAHVESLKLSTWRERGRVARVKLAIEQAARFSDNVGYEAQLWQIAATRGLHALLADRLRQAHTFEVFNGWITVVEEITRLMVYATEATRGPEMQDDNDEDLEQLLAFVKDAIDTCIEPADCLKTIKDLTES